MPDKRRLLRKTAPILLLLAICIAAAGAASIAVFTAQAPQWRQQLAQQIGQQADATVTIESLQLGWSGFGPALRLTGVTLAHDEKQRLELHVPTVQLQFSLLELLRGKRMPQAVVLQQPRISLLLPEQDLQRLLAGQPDELWDGDWWQELAALRETFDYIDIRQARIELGLCGGADTPILQLQAVDATLRDQQEALELSARAAADDWLQELHIHGRISGHATAFEQARLALTIAGLDAVKFGHTLAPEAPAATWSGGKVDLQVHANWQDGAFAAAELAVEAQALTADQTQSTLFPAWRAQFDVRPDQGVDNVLDMTLTSLSSPHAALADLGLSARLDTDTMALQLDARHVQATLLEPFVNLRYPMPRGAHLDGLLEHAQIRMAANRPLQAEAAFTGLALTTRDLATAAISGRYYRSGNLHLLEINHARGAVRSARYLQGAVPLTDLHGLLSWQPDGKALRIQASNLQLSSGMSQLTLNGSLLLAADGAPRVALSAHATTPNAALLLAHIPQAADLPFDDLRFWLPRAVQSGSVVATARMHGRLDRLFEDEGEHLQVLLHGSGFTLEYQPGWPVLHDAAGRIQLQGSRLAVDIARGRMLDVAVGPVAIDITDVRTAVMRLDGKVRDGAAARMFSFLAASPLRDKYGALVAALDLEGTAGLDLKLRLPLEPNLGETRIEGTIHAAGNSVDHAALPAPITAVRGALHFSHDGLRAEDLHGNLMGVALTTDIAPANGGSINIRSSGRVALPVNTELLAHYLPRHWLDVIDGSTRVETLLKLDRHGRVHELSLDSNLRGVAVQLPPPLQKSADSAASLHLETNLDGHLAVSYANLLTARLGFADDGLRRAIVLFGSAPTPQPPAGPGLWLGGHVEILEIDDWLAAIEHLLPGDEAQAAGNLPFLGVDLGIGVLRLGNRQVRQVNVASMPQANATGWSISVTGANAQGEAMWRPEHGSRGRLDASFSRLHIETQASETTPAAPQQQDADASALAEFDPRRLPALTVAIANLYLDASDFGRAALRATTTANGIRLEQATLAGGDLSLDASGAWSRHVGLTQAQLDYVIEGTGLERLLQAVLGQAPGIEAQSVHTRGSLRITPNDNGLSLAALDGDLSLTIKDGRFKAIEPGAGRLLGLLNLYMLPRRMTLDFSDVTGAGLEFDKISGSFDIISGNALTDDLTTWTSAAIIHIIGRIGLAARDYDLDITIVPQVGSSLALASAIFGGPVVGAAVFALQELLQMPLQSISRIHYQVRGSWDQPEIVNPRANE